MEEGSKVEGNYKGRGKWYPGKIRRENRDGTFDVDYDDGEKETRVEASLIRQGSKSPTVAAGFGDRFREGERIEADYRRRGKWLEGKVTRAHLDGTFDVDYKDGEREEHVEARSVRALGRQRDSQRDSPRNSRTRSRSPSRGNSRTRSRSPNSRGNSRTRSRSPSRREHSPVHTTLDKLLPSRVASSIQETVRMYQRGSTESTARTVFEEFDESPPTGQVTKREFKSGLKSIHTQAQRSRRGSNRAEAFEDWLSDADLEVLCNCLSYTKTGTGGIDYDHFLSFALDVDENGQDDLADLHDKLQKTVYTKARMKSKDIVKLFSTSRTFKTGFVRSSEFEKVLQRLYSRIAPAETGLLLRRFDPDKEGTVDYCSFMSWMAAGVPAEALKVKFVHQMQLLDERKVEDDFSRAASKGGELTLRDFADTMTELGAVFSSCELRILHRQLDSKDSGRVAVDALVKALASKEGKAHDRYSDRDRHGPVLVERAVQDEIKVAVKIYLEDSKKSLGRLLLDVCEESTGSINKRQLRKMLQTIKLELRESDENLLFDR
jgi:Ca2+-binding EF-hand superfamily protein